MGDVRFCSIADCGKPHRAFGWCAKHYTRWRRYGDPLSAKRVANGEPLKWIHDVALRFDGAECLSWPYSTATNGYGQVSFNDRNTPAHRVVCELAHGQPPSQSHEAAHSCGNRNCVNKGHLRWATTAENHADKLVHGTHSRGERHGASKLKEADVRKFFGLATTLTHQEIADRYGVARNTVTQILSGRKWTWLHDEIQSGLL